jgi:hypothetical protein
MTEDDQNCEDDVRLDSDPSVLLRKPDVVDKYKMKLKNRIEIKFNFDKVNILSSNNNEI